LETDLETDLLTFLLTITINDKIFFWNIIN
jgi:hypothetical protein